MAGLVVPAQRGAPLGPAVRLNRMSPQAVGLAAAWPIWATPHLKPRDQSGRGFHASTVVDTVTWGTQPTLGAALAFADGNARVDLEHGGALNIVPPFTITVWFINSTLDGSIIAEANSNSGWSLQVSGGGVAAPGAISMNIGFTGSAEYITGTTPTNDTLPHLAVFVARATGSGNGTLYLDGRDDTFTSNPGTPSYGGVTTINLNARPGLGAGFAGRVGELRIYTRALSAAEVWQLYDPATRWELYTAPYPLVPHIPVTVQYAYPTADVTDGSWTTELGSATDLYDSVNEPTTPSDSDYIQSSVNPSGDLVELALGDLDTPSVDTGHILRYRIRRN